MPEEQEDLKEHVPEDLYIYKPPVSKPWVSLGSEKEIEEESVQESKKRVSVFTVPSSLYLPLPGCGSFQRGSKLCCMCYGKVQVCFVFLIWGWGCCYWFLIEEWSLSWAAITIESVSQKRTA